MEKTIAAIHNKLVQAQKGSDDQCQKANNDCNGEAADMTVVVSQAKPTPRKGPVSHRPSSVPKADSAQAPQSASITFKQGMQPTFRAFNVPRQKQDKRRPPCEEVSKKTNDGNSGTNKSTCGKAPPSYRTATRPKLPVRIIKQPYSEDLKTWRSSVQANEEGAYPVVQIHTTPGHGTSKAQTSNKYLKAPNAFPFRDKPGSPLPKSALSDSGQNSQTILLDEIMTSSGRSTSPVSESTPSNTRSYVYLPELSLCSTTPDLDLPDAPTAPTAPSPKLPSHGETPPMSPDILAMRDIVSDIENFEPDSFLDFLNYGKVPLLEPMFDLTADPMDVDEEHA
jgi:hypothetical protein